MLQGMAEELQTPQVNLPPPSALECSVKELQVQMKQLQLKVDGKGVQVANKTFQMFLAFRNTMVAFGAPYGPRIPGSRGRFTRTLYSNYGI